MSEPDLAWRVRVIGCGNPLRGDDGVGIVAVRSLRRLLRAPDHAGRQPARRLEIIEAGRPGIALVDLLADADAALLVDAIATGAAPGTLYRLDGLTLAANLAAGSERYLRLALSSHNAGIAATLALARTLFAERLPQTVIVWGVEPESVRFDQGLSPRVAAAVPCLVGCLCADLHTVGREG